VVLRLARHVPDLQITQPIERRLRLFSSADASTGSVTADAIDLDNTLGPPEARDLGVAIESLSAQIGISPSCSSADSCYPRGVKPRKRKTPALNRNTVLSPFRPEFS
jgi:hypothetical protein